VDGRRFLAHHGLKVEKAQRFPAEAFGKGLVGFRFPEAKGQAEGQTREPDQGKTARTGKAKAAATA
jgi:hypothetical protein